MAAYPTFGREPWNKGKLVGQKAPFKLKDIWAIRIRLQLAQRKRELAHSSIWQSTASFVLATWSNYVSAMSATLTAYPPARS